MTSVDTSPPLDYLADSVDAFLTESGSPSCALPPSLARRQSKTDPFHDEEADRPYIALGLTFSFPVEQTALGSGKLLTWTKGFAAKNAIGKDVVKLLQDAFDRKNMHVRCVALVNDVGYSFPSRSYSCPTNSSPRPDCRDTFNSGICFWRMRSWCHLRYRYQRCLRRRYHRNHKTWKQHHGCRRVHDREHGVGSVQQLGAYSLSLRGAYSPIVRSSDRPCRAHPSITSSTVNPSTPPSKPLRSSSPECTSAKSHATSSSV